MLMLMSIFLKQCLTVMLIALIICIKGVVKPIVVYVVTYMTCRDIIILHDM